VGKAAGVTAPPDLLKQISTTNAAFRPAARQIVLIVGWRTWLWLHCVSICRHTLMNPGDTKLGSSKPPEFRHFDINPSACFTYLGDRIGLNAVNQTIPPLAELVIGQA
jgi:hypothetical protein